MKHIVHNRPCVNDDEIAAITQVLRKQWLIAGDEVSEFEKNFKEYHDASYAVAVNSGTSALHLSLLALGITEGDEVIIPTYTASDLLNAVHYVKAVPVLIDCAKDSCSLDLTLVPKKITRKTKVMIIPHTFGFPTDISQLYKYDIPIIEDCAQTIGSTIRDKRVGTFGVMSIFSFFATKLLTTGQGGMVLTNSKDLYEFVSDAIDYNGRDNYKVRYNYPMTDIAASMGCAQLKKYTAFSNRRKYIAYRYQEALEEKGVTYYPKKTQKNVVPFRFLLQCQNEKQRIHITEICSQHGIEVKQPIAPYELLHRLLRYDASEFPQAEYFARTVLSLPIYPCLSNSEIDYIIQTITASL